MKEKRDLALKLEVGWLVVTTTQGGHRRAPYDLVRVYAVDEDGWATKFISLEEDMIQDRKAGLGAFRAVLVGDLMELVRARHLVRHSRSFAGVRKALLPWQDKAFYGSETV